MILTAMQPTYLPWLGLMARIAEADQFCLFDVCAPDGSSQDSYESRNRILGANGPHWLSVPIHRHRNEPLSETRIVQTVAWQSKHWRAIEAAYRKAPFWDRYAPELEPFYLDVSWRYLAELDEVMLRWFMNVLGLRQPVRRASTLGWLSGTKSELVLSMCKALGADVYIFGANGRDYADVEAFKRAGIEVRFQEYHHPTYPQFGRNGTFESHLSTLDLVMNCGPDSLRILRNGGAE